MNTIFKRSGNSVYGIPFYTWSEHWVNTLSLLRDELSSLETTVINIDPNEAYGLTYSVLDDEVLSTQLHNAIDNLAEMLIELNPTRGIILFEKLLSDNFTSESVHNLFSLLSRRINDKQGVAKSMSLHSPIKPESCDKGFPVHADLFKARAILNIISRSDQFDGGDILLISFKDLSDAMHATHSMPRAVIEFIKEVLGTRISYDTFDAVFDLIHGNYPWVNDLKSAIEVRQLCIPCSYGMGYFVVDGQWLHGRTRIDGPVFESRLERLVFDTRYTMSVQAISPANEPKSYQSPVSPQDNLIHKAQKSLPNKALHRSNPIVAGRALNSRLDDHYR